MDIDGLSVQTMLKFINEGFIKQFPDIYHLPEHFDKISSMEGFGEKSCMNMQTANRKKQTCPPGKSDICTLYTSYRYRCRQEDCQRNRF